MFRGALEIVSSPRVALMVGAAAAAATASGAHGGEEASPFVNGDKVFSCLPPPGTLVEASEAKRLSWKSAVLKLGEASGSNRFCRISSKLCCGSCRLRRNRRGWVVLQQQEIVVMSGAAAAEANPWPQQEAAKIVDVPPVLWVSLQLQLPLMQARPVLP